MAFTGSRVQCANNFGEISPRPAARRDKNGPPVSEVSGEIPAAAAGAPLPPHSRAPFVPYAAFPMNRMA